MHIVSESDPRRIEKEGLVNGVGWKSRRPDSHTGSIAYSAAGCLVKYRCEHNWDVF